VHRCKANNRRLGKLESADDIDGRIVALDQATLFDLGVVFAPVPGIGAIDGIDHFTGSNGCAMEG